MVESKTDSREPRPIAEAFGDILKSQWARDARARAKAECERNRTRVLAFPDLAARLTGPTIGLDRPEQWNGYIPPRFDSPAIDGTQKPNNSPRRAVLVDLMRAVEERGREAAP